jgi:hypothetical protein
MMMIVVVGMADVSDVREVWRGLPVVEGEYADEVDGETEDTDDEKLFYFDDFFGPY